MDKANVALLPRTDALYVKLAREIAIDHHELGDILTRYGVTELEWERIRTDPRFQSLLKTEIEAWQSAVNTHERTKLKAAAMIEEWMPEAMGRLHDKGENLSAKVELGKLIARIAGMGLNNAEINGGVGEKFSVTINLGSDNQLKFEKEVTPKVIEATPND